jgi:hypothetical protein
VDAINQTIEITDAERIDHLRLIRSDNVGPRGIVAQNATGGGKCRPRFFGPLSLRHW